MNTWRHAAVLVLLVGCLPAEEAPELLVDRVQIPLAFADPDKECGECHPKHLEEWRMSNHAYAGVDPVFIAMVKLAQAQSQGRIDQFCVQCHLPVAAALNMTDVFFDEETRRFKQDVTNIPPEVKKGVTCDVCHSVDDVAETRNARLTLKPDGIRRGPIKDPVPTKAHRSAYSELHENSQLCGACHNVVNAAGALLEQTFDEWQYSKYPDQNKNCQTCHMPEYEGQAATEGPIRTVHEHIFVGVDVSLLPEDEFPGYWELRERSAALLRSSAHFDVTYDQVGQRLEVAVENLAGHSLPSGSTADRQMWVETMIRDESGEVVFESGTLDKNDDIRDGLASHSTAPGTDPELIYYGQLLLNSPELMRAETEEEKNRIRAKLSAGCRPMGRGGIDPALEVKTVHFPWSATWQCDYMIPPHQTHYSHYDLTDLDAGQYEVESRLLFRAFPPYLLRRLEVLAGLDPAVKTRLPTVEMNRVKLSIHVP